MSAGLYVAAFSQSPKIPKIKHALAPILPAKFEPIIYNLPLGLCKRGGLAGKLCIKLENWVMVMNAALLNFQH